ncbi:MAG: VF530 family protein [Desulfobulbus sp.]|jgi:uncharacterized protein (DUF2132 family)|nr:VF530 family protein [Desulfobulbus sp.]
MSPDVLQPMESNEGRTSSMNGEQPKNPLHGVTLESVVVQLVDHYGWEELADRITIKCFKNNPSVKSSLQFLRKTPWARGKVERLYISTFIFSGRAKKHTSRRPGGR